MFSSSTISNINGAMVDGATNALSEYRSIFLLMAGIVLAFVIMEYLSTIINPRRDNIDGNRDERDY